MQRGVKIQWSRRLYAMGKKDLEGGDEEKWAEEYTQLTKQQAEIRKKQGMDKTLVELGFVQELPRVANQYGVVRAAGFLSVAEAYLAEPPDKVKEIAEIMGLSEDEFRKLYERVNKMFDRTEIHKIGRKIAKYLDHGLEKFASKGALDPRDKK